MNTTMVSMIENKEISNELTQILNRYGFHILPVLDVEQIEARLAELHPALLLVQGNAAHSTLPKACKQIKESQKTKNIPILFIDHIQGTDIDSFLQLGIEDYLYWPATPLQVITRVNSVLNAHISNQEIERITDIKTQELIEMQTVLIESLAMLAEYRDEGTGKHIKRAQNYVKALAIELRKNPRYAEEEALTDQDIEAIYLSVPMHDIGKVGLRDDILLKPGKLDCDEYENMKLHTILGYDVIKHTVRKLKNSTFLKYAGDLAYTHQEKWDGTGYPQGLKGEEIPLVGRLMAVADVYDALISQRSYKDALTHEEARGIIVAGKGSHFDPDVVDAFLAIEETIKNIAVLYAGFEYVDEQGKIIYGDEKLSGIDHVLVVDDSRLVLAIIENQLTNIGYTVKTAQNGEEAFELYLHNPFELIITDLEMPVLNGYELVQKIRSDPDPRGQEVIIVAMTSAQYNLTPENAKKYGFDDYLLKPFDLDLLKNKLVHLDKQIG